MGVASGRKAESVTIPVAGEEVEAILARPDDGEAPGVLLFMDAFGLRPQIRAMAERIASWGYVVLAPHVFHRSGPVSALAPTGDLRDPETRAAAFGRIKPSLDALTAEQAVADIHDYVTALRDLPGVASGPIGVTGYCMGARLAVRAAGARPEDVAACGGFHGGGLVTERPDSPHLALPGARAEFVFGHADQDPSMAPEAVAALGGALDAAGLRAANEIYPGAAHGYTMADTASYDEDAAERHYRELRALFDRTLR